MQNNTIRWGIIGCGNVAEVKSGPAFQKIAQSELVAVMRRNGAKAKDFAERHGVPEWYDNADQILEHPGINAVYIATPPSSHVEYTIKAIENGKDIYLEKPVTRTSVDAEIIKDAIKGKNNKLTIAHYRRKMTAFLKVKELLDAKAIGDVRLVDIQILQPAQTDIITDTGDNWRLNPEISGGGYFFDLAPHQIDLMLTWFGQPKRMKGFGANQQGVYSANDVVNGIMEFQNGVQFRGVWAFNLAGSDKLDRCTIYGDLGSITFSFFGDQVFHITREHSENFSTPAIPHVQQPMIEATVRYFLGKGDNPCSIDEAIQGLKVMEVFAS